MQHLIPAEFLGTSVQIVDRDGQKWLTAEEVGRCLGYDNSNARKGVMKLYERHGDEFPESDTCVVNLTTQGQARAMRIFSATGCIKLGFFANTPRAKDFRSWASRVLVGQQPAQLPAPTAGDLALAQEVGSLRDTLAAQNQAIIELYKRVETAQRGHIRAVTRLLGAEKRQASRDTRELIISLEAQGVHREEIQARTGKPYNYIRQILYLARQAGRLPESGTQQGHLDLGGAQ